MTERLKTRINAPLLIPTLFFAAGISAGRHQFFEVNPHYIHLLLAGAFILNIFLVSRPLPLIKSLSVGLVFFLVGQASFYSNKQAPLPDNIISLTGSAQDTVLTGTLRTAPSFNGNKGKFIVDVDQLKNSGNELSTNTRILFKTPFPPPVELIPGKRVLLRASLAVPTPPGVPGGFDYRQYLADRGIQLTGYIRSPVYIAIPDSQQFRRTAGTSWYYLPQYLRHRLNNFIDSTELAPTGKALYKAIITGQRDSLSTEVIDNFKRSGAIHLLAISGMHMGLLALLSGLLFNSLLRNSQWIMLRWPVWKISALLTLPVMGSYALVSGLQPPVVRALIMAVMLVTSIVLDRHRSLLNSLALAALLILAYDPVALFSVSFQLSFISVAAIILVSDQLPAINRDPITPNVKINYKLKKWTLTGILISLVALIATGPLTLYNFHQVSLMGPITTLLAAPLICFWALPFGLIASILSPWLPATASAILKLGGVGLHGADLITAVLAKVPFGFHYLQPPSEKTLIIYYLLGLSLLLLKSTRIVKTGLIGVMILLVALPSQIFSKSDDDITRISFIDVGQGSSTLIELAGGKKVLVDGGGSSSPNFDPGEQIIGPFLWSRAINRLDAIVISHQHLDHYNGLEFVIRNFRPDDVWINGSERGGEGYRKILTTAREVGASIKVPDHSEIIASGSNAQLKPLSSLHLRRDKDLSLNNLSLAVVLRSNDKKVILPADMMAEDGQSLIDQGVDLASDLILAPHHGSKFSAGYQLVTAGNPEWLVVSASPFKSDIYPDSKFTEWCRQKGIEILETAFLGTITFSISRDGKINWQAVSPKGKEELARRAL